MIHTLLGHSGRPFYRGLLVIGVAMMLSSSVVAGLNSVDSSGLGLVRDAGASLQPIAIAESLALGFTAPQEVSALALPTQKTLISKLEIRGRALSSLTWSVTPTGTRVSERNGKQEAFIAALTSHVVRPQAIISDAARGNLWLYGEALYRYRAASGELVRFDAANKAFGAIREIVSDTSGVWLATDNGIYFFDESKEQFSAIQHALLNGQRFVQAVAADGAVWFMQEPSRLIRLTRTASGAVQIAASRRLPLGVAAELIAVNQTVWMLASRENGEYYELAFISPQREGLQRVSGKFYSLREQQGRLFASTHRTLHVFDPRAGTVAVLDVDTSRALQRSLGSGQVLFVGSSYGMKDNCEIVEHRRVDISKGWMTPALDLYVPTTSIGRRSAVN